jgi:hypothetical protein
MRKSVLWRSAVSVSAANRKNVSGNSGKRQSGRKRRGEQTLEPACEVTVAVYEVFAVLVLPCAEHAGLLEGEVGFGQFSPS